MFPYYKARRKTDRDESPLDWNQFFTMMNKIRDEIRDYFPYKVIRVDKAEADDIIAVITKECCYTDKILILSGDKDYQQLQKYPNVSQYNPVLKKWLKCVNPEAYLKEHIIKAGDDGIPNILSKDSSFVEKIRQTPITAKRLATYMSGEPEETMDSQTLRNYNRNKILIDFNEIPQNLVDEILEQYNNPPGAKDRSQLFNYFITHKLKNLMTSVGEF